MGPTSRIIDSFTNAVQRLHDMAENVDDTIHEYSPFAFLAETQQNDVYILKEMLQQLGRAELLDVMEKMEKIIRIKSTGF